MSARSRPTGRRSLRRVGTIVLVALALVLAACGGGDEPVELSGESAAAVAALVVDGLRAESEGLIEADEGECIANGLVSTSLVDEFFAQSNFEVSDYVFGFDDVNDLSQEERDMMFLVMLGCMPTVKLLTLGQLAS